MPIDSLRPTGLDTLSERSLRRLTDRYTGELRPADSSLSASEGPLYEGSMGENMVDSAEAIFGAQVEATPLQSVEAVSRENFNLIIEQWQLAREHYHDAAVEQVLGPSSHLAQGVAPIVSEQGLSPVAPLTEVALSPSWWDLSSLIEPLYGVLIVASVFLYGFCLYRYFDDIVALFSSVFGDNMLQTGRKGERLRSDIFYGSLGKLFILGVGFVGLISGIVSLRLDVPLAVEIRFYMPLVAIVMFLGVVTTQNFLLGVVGLIINSAGEISQLMRIRLVYFVMATVMVAPVLLVALMGSGVEYDLWFKAACVGAGVVFVLFLRESIKFFLQKKVSILHWILYLCTVEILPLSLLWQAVVRLR